MAEDLRIGREIQLSLLPTAAVDRPEVGVHAAILPALEVGGDFYDHYLIDAHRFCVCVGDVAGKGVPAALFMAVTKTLVRDQAVGRCSTGEIVTRVNREITRSNPAHMFASLFLAILDTRNGDLHYTCAGHPPAVVCRTDGSLGPLDSRHGATVGVLEDTVYGETIVRLGCGDTLLAYTDGVTETTGPHGNLFGAQRLTGLLTRVKSCDSSDLVTAVTDAVAAFQGSAPQADDITVLALRYNGPVVTFEI